MEPMTISQVSKILGISTRMLRYYEKAGLIESRRKEGYAYRIYNENTVCRLRRILLLRKLRIPVRQIKIILQNPNAATAVEIFQKNINELDEEITALSTIREILSRFANELANATGLPLQSLLEKDDILLESIESLALVSINFKEDQTMEKLNQANISLSQPTDIRVIYLPPAAIAAAHYVGDEPENHVNTLLDGFVRENKLHKIKPDLRRYGFNHPNPVDETGYHGYEAWVTIPEDMEVPAPLIKKHFAGGLYAAHMIAFGNFNEWEQLFIWANQSEKYEFAGDMKDQEHMCGMLEEHLNYVNHVELENTEPEDFQLDLLLPLREKQP